MPNSKEIRKKYAGNKGSYPQAHAVIIYDLQNHNFVDAEFLPAPADERKACLELLKNCPEKEKEIYILDRGFPSLEVIQKLNMQNRNYVMRMSKSFLKEVNEFIESTKMDKEIEMEYKKKRYKEMSDEVILPYRFRVRCVKIERKGRGIKYLITNLSQKECTTEDIGILYDIRWKTETENNHLKHATNIEGFCSKKENSIKQEFYARLITHNLIGRAVVIAEGSDPYEKKTKT